MFTKQKRQVWGVHVLFNFEYNPLHSAKAKLDNAVAYEKNVRMKFTLLSTHSIKYREA